MTLRWHCDVCDKAHPTADACDKCERQHLLDDMKAHPIQAITLSKEAAGRLLDDLDKCERQHLLDDMKAHPIQAITLSKEAAGRLLDDLDKDPPK